MLAFRTLVVKKGAVPRIRSSARDYLKTPKWPRMSHRMMKMVMVLKHPPPNFFAPYPAASPRSSLLMILERPVDDLRTRTAALKAETVPPEADHDTDFGIANPDFATARPAA